MLKQISISILLTFIFLPQILLAGGSRSVQSPKFSEQLALNAVVLIHGAQMTYAATAGGGNYAATLEALGAVGFVDPLLASGNKYGYAFTVSATPATTQSPASFVVRASPQRYPKTGRRSFYSDASGRLRGADKNGEPATSTDPQIEVQCGGGNEACAIGGLRTIHGAEITYSATSGNGNYGSLTQLGMVSLLPENIADGAASGYLFAVTTTAQTPNSPAGFSVTAVPATYGVTGFRSFFIGTDGVIRFAYRNGLPATENDPPLDF